MKPICPRCNSMVRDVLLGTKKQLPRWKTKVKGKLYECRYCGFIREEK
jgi:uncharacterized protein with PIN domain